MRVLIRSLFVFVSIGWLYTKGIAMDDELLTVGEVARRLRVDDTTVRRWIKDGTLEAVILPHLNERQGYRIRRLVVDAILQSSAYPGDTASH